MRALRPASSTFLSAGLCLVLCLRGGVAWAGAPIVASVDGGGKPAGSTSYVNDGSLGGIASGSSFATPGVTNLAGYVGQLTEVVALSVTSMPTVLDQAATSQLSGLARLDDGTFSHLDGSELAWSTVSYPFLSLTGNGVLQSATHVYAQVSGTVTGGYFNVRGNTSVQVRGPYANAGIPDAWLVHYFGAPPNALAAPTVDADGDGLSNWQEYLANTDPTNNASRLAMINVEVKANDVFVTWVGGTDAWQVIECTGNLADTNAWVAIFTNTPPMFVTNTYKDFNVGSASNLFYRVKVWRQ